MSQLFGFPARTFQDIHKYQGAGRTPTLSELHLMQSLDTKTIDRFTHLSTKQIVICRLLPPTVPT